jgi:hypothetical protein
MHKYLSVVLLVLLALLSACAPGARGSNPTMAFRLNRDDVRVTPGATYYLKAERLAGSLGLTIQDLTNQQMRGAAVGQRFRDAIHGLSASQLGLPESWDFRLHSATGVKEITEVTERGSSISVGWSETVELVFVLTLPVSTDAGSYSALVSIAGKGGKGTVVSLDISVENGSLPSSPQVALPFGPAADL